MFRPSETFVGDYSLSFWRRDEVHHVPIRKVPSLLTPQRLVSKCPASFLLITVFFKGDYISLYR
jgi:hypothetical protein